jgi:hypothetical protein
LDRGDVSQRHAYFQVLAGRVFGYDLPSRTGLHWGEAAVPAGRLDRARPVRVGPFRNHV